MIIVSDDRNNVSLRLNSGGKACVRVGRKHIWRFHEQPRKGYRILRETLQPPYFASRPKAGNVLSFYIPAHAKAIRLSFFDSGQST